MPAVPDFRCREKLYAIASALGRDLCGSVWWPGREEQKLMNLAYTDPGTSIYNKYNFTEHAKNLMRQKQPFILICLDLDDLKHVNDHFGHLEGDSYIKKMVEKVKQDIGQKMSLPE